MLSYRLSALFICHDQALVGCLGWCGPQASVGDGGASVFNPTTNLGSKYFYRQILFPNCSAVRPHCSTVRPHERPHSAAERLHSAAERPHSAAERPHCAAERPNSAAERPNSAAERPNFGPGKVLRTQINSWIS